MIQETFPATTTDTAMPANIDRVIWALDFPAEAWLTILNAIPYRPSERRAELGETLETQVRRLPMRVANTARERTGTSAPAECFLGMPWSFHVATLEVIERFWTRPAHSGPFEEQLAATGVHLHKSPQEKVQALRIKWRGPEA